jgi:hypothetical protein
MSSQDLIRWSGLAAMVAAVLWVVGDLLNLTVLFSPEPFSEEAQTGSDLFNFGQELGGLQPLSF